jgi:hypothetical protein
MRIAAVISRITQRWIARRCSMKEAPVAVAVEGGEVEEEAEGDTNSSTSILFCSNGHLSCLVYATSTVATLNSLL